MGTLYIDRRGARLDFDRDAVVIREPETGLRTVPLSLIDRLVVIGSAQISATVLTRLAENGSGIVLMPGRYRRRNAYLCGDGHGDITRRVGQYELVRVPDLRVRWAQRLVWLRLAGQRRVLNSALRLRPDRRLALRTALDEIQQAMFEVRREERLAALRGREGAATAAYYRGFRHLFAPSLGFDARRRRPPPDPVNAALSLGYTLSHGDALRAVVISGLEPMLGILHEPAYSRESLACDLNELARARIERLVWRLFAEQTLDARSFTQAREAVLLAKSARSTFFKAYEASAGTHRRWLTRVARSLARECVRLGETSFDSRRGEP